MTWKASQNSKPVSQSINNKNEKKLSKTKDQSKTLSDLVIISGLSSIQCFTESSSYRWGLERAQNLTNLKNPKCVSLSYQIMNSLMAGTSINSAFL